MREEDFWEGVEKVKALVKGAVDQGMAPMEILENGLRPAMEEIGADGYGENAAEAINLVKELVK